jgi:hypothetical protein
MVGNNEELKIGQTAGIFNGNCLIIRSYWLADEKDDSIPYFY